MWTRHTFLVRKNGIEFGYMTVWENVLHTTSGSNRLFSSIFWGARTREARRSSLYNRLIDHLSVCLRGARTRSKGLNFLLYFASSLEGMVRIGLIKSWDSRKCWEALQCVRWSICWLRRAVACPFRCTSLYTAAEASKPRDPNVSEAGKQQTLRVKPDLATLEHPDSCVQSMVLSMSQASPKDSDTLN